MSFVEKLVFLFLLSTVVTIFYCGFYEKPCIVKFKTGEYAIRKKELGKYYYYKYGPSLWYEYPTVTYKDLEVVNKAFKDALDVTLLDNGEPIK